MARHLLLFSGANLNIISKSKLRTFVYRKSQRSCAGFVLLCDHQVELAGIEPASKQGSLRLSTCLSYDWIFDRSLSISTLITTYLLDLG